MSEPTVTHATFVLEREYPAPPERVFTAFSDPAKKRRWFAEGENHTVDHFEMDFRAGGFERIRSHFAEGSLFPGKALLSDAIFHDIIPNQRIVTSSVMTFGDYRMSASLVTMEFLPAGTGTNLVITHQGAFFPGSDGPERREGGWRKIVERLSAELLR
jgi:uncharacterized protein YndB with AHSA1/START domain